MATKHTQATTRSSLTVVKNALQVASEAESVESLPTTHRSYPEATPSDDLRGIIIDRFLGEVRSFASEIIEGTNRYRQLQALVEHLPHDYHDRFLIELIQNAHDVSDGGEVRIVFQEPSPSGPGLLYVANRGQPFSESNFGRICSIGWSDKDPSRNIGNKGLGFRSVLQICRTPEIFSVHPQGAHQDGGITRFDGLSFYFLPEARKWAAEALDEVGRGAVGADQYSDVLSGRLGRQVVLFDEPSRVKKFRRRLADNTVDLFKEAEWLSPYSLPIPSPTEDDVVRQLGADGFVTVVRLLLDMDGALEAVRRAIDAVIPEYMLFLPAITQLTLVHLGVPTGARNLSRVLKRESLRGDEIPHPEIVEPVRILSIPSGQFRKASDAAARHDAELQAEARSYWITRRPIEGAELREAVKHLPPNWHEVERAEVSLAIEITNEQPRAGYFSIYLPTQQSTGMAVWVNGPFFGNLARTHIEFGEGEEYNRLLLREAAVLLEELRTTTAALADESAAPRLIDLIDVREDSSPLAQALSEHWKGKGLSWSIVPAVVAARAPAGEPLLTAKRVILPPQECLEPGRVISFERIVATSAHIPAWTILAYRREALERLLGRAGRDNPRPAPSVIAEWLERVAATLLAKDAPIDEWQRFYEEAAELLDPKNSAVLRERRVLLTNDGSLHAAGEAKPRVFAPPSRNPALSDDHTSTQQPDETDPRLSIPKVLQEYVAFFDPRIQLVSTGPGHRHRVGDLLRGQIAPLVANFDTREIVNNVLAPMLEQLPQVVSSGSKEEEICSAALGWAYRLYSSASVEGSATNVKWEALRVPTDEGWIAGQRVYLSRGWGGKVGELLERAFRGAKAGARHFLVSPVKFRELLSIDEAAWSGTEEERWTRFLVDRVGVWNRPMVHKLEYKHNTPLEEQRGLVFSGAKHKADLTQLRNVLSVPDKIFAQYGDFVRNNAKVDVVKRSQYVFQRQTFLDGLGQLDAERAKVFAKLVARFLRRYKEDLRTAVRRPNNVVLNHEFDTLLGFALRRMKWVPTGGGSIDEELTSLDKVWFVDPALLGSPASRIQFSFVPHVAPEVAEELKDSSVRGLSLFREIPPKSFRDALALLADLEDGWSRTTSEHIEYFIGIWQDTLHDAALLAKPEHLATTTSLAEMRQPSGLLVRRPKHAGGSSVEWLHLVSAKDGAKGPAEKETPVYIPDDAALAQSLSGLLPIAVLRREHEADQLALLQLLFGEHRVHRLSEVPLQPIVTNNLDRVIDSSHYLLEDFRWLGLVALAVLAFGRAREMKLDGKEFRDQILKLRRIKIAKVQGLALAAPNGERRPFTCYYWADKETLLISTDRLEERSGGIAAGFRAIFEVADIEDALARALDALPSGLLDTGETPSEDQLIAAVGRVRVGAEQFARIQRSLLEDSAWTVARCIPAICAIRGWTTSEEVKPACDLERAKPDAIEAEVEQLLSGNVGSPVRPQELLKRARTADSDEDMARWLWNEADVDLGRWNCAVQALGNKYRVLENDEIDTTFYCFVEELVPVCRALIREALRSNGRLAEYRQWKSKLTGQLSPEAQWRREYWQLPVAPVLALVRYALQELALDSLDLGRISSVLSEDAASVADIIAAAREVGLNVDHDEGATLQRAAECIRNVHRECTRYLVARWGQNNPPPAQLPKGIVNPDGVEELSTSA